MKLFLKQAIITFLCVILTHASSKYQGVTWSKRDGQWKTSVYLGSKQCKCGAQYDNELDAAKRVNQICDELKIERKNPDVDAMPIRKIKCPSSKYKGVTWNKNDKKWYAYLYLGSKKYIRGTWYDTELDAAKRVNQLCDEWQIKRKNPDVDAMPIRKTKTSTVSQYRGVIWAQKDRRWLATVYMGKNKKYYGGYFCGEVEAAKKVNQICDGLGIEQKNPEVNMMPEQQKQLSSCYRGLIMFASPDGNYQCNNCGKYAIKNGIMYGRRGCDFDLCSDCLVMFKLRQCENNKNTTTKRKRIQLEERVNKTDDKDVQNNTDIHKVCFLDDVDHVVNSPKSMKNANTPLDYHEIQENLEDLRKILNKSNDRDALAITETLNAAIHYGEETIMTEINLQTKNGESAISIAAQHGFSNIVKFLISKGANKEHFTNEHHTPLSLAVSQNHFKVVQVLFEDWISPNSHEEPYLHLLPIFNVKSREIAQLLIDNDAITDNIYNENYQTPLTVACQNGFLDVVKFFLDDGLDINHLDKENKDPIFYALANKHHDVVNLLISRGVSSMLPSRELDKSF